MRGLLVGLLCLCSGQARAQFDYGEAGLFKGRVMVSGVEEVIDYGLDGQGKRSEFKRTRSQVDMASELQLQLVIQDIDAQLKLLAQAKTKKLGNLGHTSPFIVGNNFTATMGQGQVASRDPKPPKWPVTGGVETITSLPPLCGEGALTPSFESSLATSAKEAVVTLQLVPTPDALDRTRACVSVGWGLDRTVSGTTTARQLELDSAKSECATRWNTLAPSPAIGAPLLTVGDCLGAANVDETRSDATSTVEVHYPSIEVAQLIAFTKDLSKAKAFTMPFSSTSKTPEQTRTIQGTMTLTLGVPVVSTLQVLPADEKLYGSWLPVPGGAPMKVLARLDPADVSAKADFLDFSLTDVTAYPGSWGNSRDTDLNQTGPDLVFAQTQEDPNVQRIDELHARTITKVKSAKVLLEVRDFAAFGVVKVRAREQAIEGKTWPEGSPGLSVPRDREGNKVGDAWEEQHQNVQLDLTWDQEEVKGRKAKGDNLSYLEEYRGFKVLVKGKEEHLRLSPDKQEIFVCDPENVALEDAWEKASQTKMIKIARSHLLRPSPEDVNDAIEWRTVDTRGDKNKHAAYISYVRSSDPNFDPANSGDVNHCGYLDEWQAHIAYTSDCDGLVHLFDARFRGSFETYRVWVDRALAGDPWAAGALANVAKSHRVSLASLKTLAKQRAASWSADADIGSLTREHSNFIVLHEIAHMLRAPGHLRPVEGVELPQESTQGDLSCPMAYSPMEERLELIIYGAKKPVPPLRGRTRFCSGGTDDCFGDIDCRQ